ncbi:MAG: putative dsRNA-binding protein [Clostridiales bacterium]|nr:putative dsRNA-binding protein [Clostridiales bacterium]
MEAKDIRFIQNQIGYEFSNTDLLQQAFVRRSYSNENGGQNNEVLEFIGDKVLDFVVVKLLCTRFGSMTSDAEWNEYECQHSEGKLTVIKKSLVQKSNLAYRIRMLGLEQFLIMGQSDYNQNVQNEDSVQEDLFEAILGAIAIDSNWDMQTLQEAVEIMLNPDENFEGEENYVEMVQEWMLRDSGSIPLYHFEKVNSSTWYFPFDGVSQSFNVLGSPEERELMQSTHCCLLKIRDNLPKFRGFGRSKNQARKNVCKLAYEYLKKNDYLFTIEDEIDEPSKDQAINQLEILARRGYFPVPTYDFSEEYDYNGNPVWQSKCMIEGESKVYKAKSSSKKEAKKQAAYKMLKYVLENY